MSPDLTLAIPVVDYQHEKILHFIDNLKHRAATRPEVIQAIDDYTGRHFVVEEEFMIAHGYPDFQRHKAEHDRNLMFPQDRQWIACETGHFDLLCSLPAYERIRQWLAQESPALVVNQGEPRQVRRDADPPEVR